MNNNKSLIDMEKDLNIDKTPFYKRKKFLIRAGILLSVIIIIIIIIAVVVSKPSKFIYKSFIESTEYIANPDQGHSLPLRVYLAPDSFTYENYMANQSYHLRCDLGEFSAAVNSEKKNKELTNKVLKGLDDLLYKIKSQNQNAIIRFFYDNFQGIGDLEPPLSMIEKHIKQLGPILNKHLDTLTAIEAGMLGKWGEMHGSAIATEENKVKLFNYWLDNTKDIPILTRVPRTIYLYFNKTFEEMENYTINRNDKGSRLGVFNDCFLSSSNDVGTYFDRAREIKWLSKINEYLPFMGVVCEVCNMSDLEIAIPEIRLLHLTHINGAYESVPMNKWKNLKYNSALGDDSLYYGMSGYDYINAHFGYRLVIRSIEVSYKKGSEFDLTVNIDNVGFGNLLKEKKVDILYTDFENNILKTEYEARTYKGEKILEIKGELLHKGHDDYHIFLRLYGSFENNTVFYPVQFANKNIYNNTISANLIFSVNKEGKIYI